MRTILIGDIIAAARAIMVMPLAQQQPFLQLLLEQAHAAHLFHKHEKRPHPEWGNGSLMARANAERQVPEPFASDGTYLRALQVVIGALILRNANGVAS